MQAQSTSPQRKTSLRLSDIHKLIRARYGGPCRTSDALRYLQAAIPELMRFARSWRYALSWVRDWVPVLIEEHGDDFIRHQWVKIAKRKRPNLTSDQLSKLLVVSDDEPARLNLRCIPAASRTAEIRATERRASKAKAEAARRAKEPGYTPRSESAMATKPWHFHGMGRSYWYAKLKAERLVAAAEPKILAVDDFMDIVSVCPLVPLVDRNMATVSVSTSPCSSSPSAAPAWTGSWTPVLPAPQVETGQEAPKPVTPANDQGSPPAFEVDGFKGVNVTLKAWQIQDARTEYPELDADLGGHLAAVDALMSKTPAWNHIRVARNLLKDRGRKVRRSLKAANTNEKAVLVA